MQEAKRGEDKGSMVVDYDTAVDLLNGLARLAEASLRVGCDTGILDEDEEAIRFFHQLLQEFFAARQLAAAPDFARLAVPDTVMAVAPPLTEVLAQLAPGEPLPPLPTTGWEETAVMAAALAEDPDAYVRNVLAVNPALAGRCLAAPDVRADPAVRPEVTHTLVNRSTDPATDIHGTEAPRAPAYWYDSLLAHPSAPVVGVSVYEAEAYCAWLSAVTGGTIGLPTEYEWEAAASAGGRAFPYGDDFEPFVSNTFELHARGTLPVCRHFPRGTEPRRHRRPVRQRFRMDGERPGTVSLRSERTPVGCAQRHSRLPRGFLAPSAQQGSGGVPGAGTVLRTQ